MEDKLMRTSTSDAPISALHNNTLSPVTSGKTVGRKGASGHQLRPPPPPSPLPSSTDQYAEYVLSDDERENKNNSNTAATTRVETTLQPHLTSSNEEDDLDDDEGGIRQQLPASLQIPDTSNSGKTTSNSRNRSKTHILNYIRSFTGKIRTKKEGGSGENDSDDESSSSQMSGVEDDEDEVEEDDEEEEIDPDDYDSWDDDSTHVEDDTPNGILDWGALPLIPNKFVVDSSGSKDNNDRDTSHHDIHLHIPRLDADMLEQSEQMSKLEGNIFVCEHALLLRAVMQLLIERDLVGVEGSVDDVDNIIKRGPLKKTVFSVRSNKKIRASWALKYVEVRRGNLTYYDDSAAQRHDRRIIHLRRAEAVVQVNTALQRGSDGFPFELLIQGNPPRYWMARSEEERQAWIRAIETAMIGGEDGERHHRRRCVIDLSSFESRYETSIQACNKLRQATQAAEFKDVYIESVKQAKTAVGNGPIQLPVQWLRNKFAQLEKTNADKANAAAAEVKEPSRKRSPNRAIKSSMLEFWDSMRKLNVSINGYLIPPKSAAAPERVIGSLTRCILEYDKAARDQNALLNTGNAISELQAVSYTRHILSSVLQSKREPDARNAVEFLLQGQPDFVYVSQELEDEAELTTRLEVSFAGDDLPEEFWMAEPDSDQDMSSWMYVARRRSKKSNVTRSRWRRRYAVLSGAVLSFYEAALPRPHGLRGQFVLSAESVIEVQVTASEASADGNANTTSSAQQQLLITPRSDLEHAICISTPGQQDCLLCFEHLDEMEEWQTTLEQQKQDLISRLEAHQDEGTMNDDSFPRNIVATTTTTSAMLKGAERVIKVAADRYIKGATHKVKSATDGVRRATDGSMKAMKRAKDTGMRAIRRTVRTLRYTKDSTSSSTNTNSRSSTPAFPSRSLLIRRATSRQLLPTPTDTSGKREPSIQCIVQRSSTFSVRSAVLHHPYYEDSDDDDDEDDHWLTVHATWYQAFLMSGGPSGRINSGDALLELDFLNKYEEEEKLDQEEWVGELHTL